MPKARQVILSKEQKQELMQARDHHAKAYVRVKAAAILKVAAGQSVRQVAAHGLLKAVKEEVVGGWIDRYLDEGLPGLLVRKGRGRKPAFARSEHPVEVEVAAAQLSETLHQSPELFGLPRARWWLDGIRQSIQWMQPLSLPGVRKLLARFEVQYKRGRRYVHSPDEFYASKAAIIRVAMQQAQADPAHVVLLYQDELTYYRCPSVFCDYAPTGSDGPRAAQGSGYNTSRRIAGCLDALSGRLISWQRSAFDHQTFLRYLLDVQTHYPNAERIYVVLDNWPVHFQEDVLTGLADSRMHLLFLPTYAPWLNPIEKVWRKLKQEVLHLHRYSSQWKDLQQRVQEWLDKQDRADNSALLHYVGLSPT